MKKLSRKDFLKALGVGIGALGAEGARRTLKSYDNTLKIFTDSDKTFNFLEAAQLAIRMDKLYDAFPKPDLEMTDESLINWALEILPFYEYENMTDSIVVPQTLEFKVFIHGKEHMHVLGRSNCVDWAILNYRYTNPNSPMYGDNRFLGTLAHELAHVQQGSLCDTESSTVIENSAQLVMLEVLAAMANYGSYEAAHTLVTELRDIALSTAYSISLREDNLKAFEFLKSYISPGAIKSARFNKSRRFWASDPKGLETILLKYTELPMNLISYGLANDNTITGLALSEGYASFLGINTPTMSKNSTLVIDDLAYFLKNAEQMMPDYANQ